MKKITKATIKSFINKNIDNLYIKTESDFDPMTDCVQHSNDSKFIKAEKKEEMINNTLGVRGAWFVGQSRDYFTPYEKNGFFGYEVYNCCGSFILAIKQ